MELSHIEAVTFDVGGTLFQPATPFEQLWAAELKCRGFVMNPAELLRAFGAQVERTMGAPREVIRDLPRYQTTWLEICRRTLETIGFQGDLRETTHVLWQALVIGKVRPYDESTRRSKRSAPLVSYSELSPTGTSRLNPHCVGTTSPTSSMRTVPSESIAIEKPEPGIFHHALALLGLSADRALHIGDSYEQDVLGAQGAGLLAILLARDGAAVREDVLAIRSLGEVVELLEV